MLSYRAIGVCWRCLLLLPGTKCFLLTMTTAQQNMLQDWKLNMHRDISGRWVAVFIHGITDRHWLWPVWYIDFCVWTVTFSMEAFHPSHSICDRFSSFIFAFIQFHFSCILHECWIRDLRIHSSLNARGRIVFVEAFAGTDKPQPQVL